MTTRVTYFNYIKSESSGVTPLANKPAGLTTLVDWDMNDTIPTADGPIGASGMSIVGNSNGYASLVTNEDGPQSSPSAVQFLYPDGLIAGQDMPSIYVGFSASDIIYVAIWAKWEVGFEWNTASNKLFIAQINDVHLQSYSSGYLTAYESGSPLISNDITVNDLADGQWHYIEWLVDGTIGAVGTWLDGTTVLTPAPGQISTVGGYVSLRAPDGTWGGVTAPKVGNSYAWFDHLHVAVGN